MQRRTLTTLGAGVAWTILLGAGAAAAEGEPPAAPDPQLQARMAAEKDARKQCKTSICKTFANRTPDGAGIACDITKTFLKPDITQKILSGKISWPWGDAQCTTHVDLDGTTLAKLVSEPETTVKLKTHEFKCTVEKGASGDAAQSYVLGLSITPEVTFKDGRATKVKLNWGKIDAPLLAKSAIWSATTVDSAMNVIGNSAASHINEFIYESCKDVGIEIAQPKTEQPKQSGEAKQ